MTPVSPDNPYKRHIDAVQRVYECTNRWKAQRLDEESATPSAPDESAPVPENVPENNAKPGPTEDDTDASSELSESSEEPSSDSSEDDGSEGEEESEHDEEEVVNLRANRGTKPDYKLSGDEEDIRPFLKDFLPKLKAANEELEAQKKAGKLQSTEITGEDDEEAKGEYIEMSLGLGVLEEKDDSASAQENKQEKNESVDEQESDILGKLMGKEKAEEPVGIQEVPDVRQDTNP